MRSHQHELFCINDGRRHSLAGRGAVLRVHHICRVQRCVLSTAAHAATRAPFLNGGRQAARTRLRSRLRLSPHFAALPFLHRTVLLLYPGLLAVAVYFVALLLNWNISRSVFRYYGLQED